jgi:hypothetical protein
MTRRPPHRAATRERRGGLTAVETVMSAGVLIPIGAALFFLALEALPYLFAAVQDVVCPPFL